MATRPESRRMGGGQNGLPAGSYDDRELTLAFQRGEEGAYQAIYDRHAARVQAICRRMLGQPDDAQEAAQEAFLRVYLALRAFNGRYQLGAWIARVTTNVCLDHLRARSRRPSEAELIEDLDCGQAYDADPGRLFERDAEGRRVRRVLASLPPLHRAAIVLRDFEGFSYGEIAGALSLSESQVKALLHRARRGFKRSWTEVGVSALIPTRLLGKLKRPEQPQAATHAHEIAGPAAQLSASCSGVLQQCGQIVSERLAPVVTAALVGTGGIAVAMTGQSAPEQRTAEFAAPTVVSSPDTTAARKKARTRAAPAPQPSANAAGDASTPSEGQPSPSATPTPSGSSAPSPAPSKQPSPSPTLAPEPAGFTLSFSTGTDGGHDPCSSCMEDTWVRSENVAVAGSGMTRFDQDVSGSASEGDTPTFGLRLTHSGTARGSSARFMLANRDGTYAYNASATAESRKSTDWGGWVHVYRGTYELSGAPKRHHDMPKNGTYRAEIAVSPKGRLVSVRVALDT